MGAVVRASYIPRDGICDARPLSGIVHAHHSGLVADRVRCCDLCRLDMAISGCTLRGRGSDFSGSYEVGELNGKWLRIAVSR